MPSGDLHTPPGTGLGRFEIDNVHKAVWFHGNTDIWSQMPSGSRSGSSLEMGPRLDISSILCLSFHYYKTDNNTYLPSL